jgi:hypothetical protein
MSQTNITVYGAYWCPNCRRRCVRRLDQAGGERGRRRRERGDCDQGVFEERMKVAAMPMQYLKNVMIGEVERSIESITFTN